MFNNVYQEYINNMLGTNPNYNRIENLNFENTINTNQIFQNQVSSENLEKLYPEIYKLLYPMIQHACMKNTSQLSESTINAMVEEIYSNFVANPGTEEDFNSNNEFRSGKSLETVVTGKTKSSILATSKRYETTEKRQVTGENYILRDLIRILILMELIGRPGVNRPGWQEQPFNTLFRPRDFSFSNSIYETNFDY